MEKKRITKRGGLAKINCCQNLPIHSWVIKVQDLNNIVGENEGEHRILHQVIERTTSKLVQLRQIFIVCYVTCRKMR